MRLRRLAFVFLAAVFGASAVSAVVPTPIPEAYARQVSPITQPVTGTLADGGTFAGTLTLTRFAAQQGQLVALGTLTGTLTDATGAVLGTVTNQAVALPVTNLVGSCQVLHLELGPLDLDLLGLVVHLDRVVLDITAQPGSGNLLGNLLCALARLLDAGGALAAIAALLNQILAAL
jgi:hypothetical protein